MPPAKRPEGGFAQKALVVIFSAAIVAMVGGLGTFFYWLAGSTVAIMERTTRIEEKVGSLLISRADQARELSQRNSRRLDEIEQEVNGE